MKPNGIAAVWTLALLGLPVLLLPTVDSARAQVVQREPSNEEKVSAKQDDGGGKPLPIWLQELIRSVERSEELYEDLHLDVTSRYEQGITEILKRITVVTESRRFRFEEETYSRAVPTELEVPAVRTATLNGGELPSGYKEQSGIVVFDGQTCRSFFGRHSRTETGPRQSSSHARISDEPPALTNLVRPHMFLLESGCPRVPLSTYLKGIDAVLAYLNNHYSENGPITVEDLGEQEFQGLKCRKIRIEQTSNSWELWLANERNLIPVRNLGYTHRWSKKIPVSESIVGSWKELRPGVWFPLTARTDRYDSQTVRDEGKQILSWRKSYHVVHVSLDPAPAAETFTELDFPPGTKITVTKNGVRSSRIQP